LNPFLKRLAYPAVILIAFVIGAVVSRLPTNSAPLVMLGPEEAAFVASAVAATKTATVQPSGTAQPAGTVTLVRTNTPIRPTNTITPTRPTNTPTATRPTNTPTKIASFTPSKTLLPPPTFEPPTETPPPTQIATITPTFTPFPLIDVPGLRGLETATPVSTPGCVKRKDWKLEYEVKALDSLSKIADIYGTSVDELVKANCLSNKNVIVVGQRLKVPGSSQPETRWTCTPIQNLTPQNGTMAIPAAGNITFNWYGPRTPKNLIRVFGPDGTKYEYVVELRQDYIIDVLVFRNAGTYTWYVYPLDEYFRGICSEGGPWTFTKPISPTLTPTVFR
jgi:LysM repeat protein